MAFVVIRQIYVEFIVCKKKKKMQGDQMRWATAHFQFCVVTLQWCCDRRDTTHTTGVPARRTEDPRARACLGRPVKTCLLGCSVALKSFLSQQSWLTLCSDRFWVAGDFGVATVFWRSDRVLLVG